MTSADINVWKKTNKRATSVCLTKACILYGLNSTVVMLANERKCTVRGRNAVEHLSLWELDRFFDEESNYTSEYHTIC